jgi:uncharacterized protein (TIGR02099 family)
MTAFTSTSYRLTKVAATMARVALWALVVAWIALILVWGGLHLLIVPGIAQFRPMLEAQATKAIGATVRIGALSVHSVGLIPAFALKDVTLLDAQGREALRLPRVVVALSPRSVLGLGFEQVYIEGAALDVRRDADGTIRVAGFALPESDDGASDGADWAFSQTEMVVRHGSVTWTDSLRNAPPLVLTDVDVVLRNRRRQNHMRIDATPPQEWGGRFGVNAVFVQPLLSRHPGRWREWRGEVYADMPQVDLAQLRRYVDLGGGIAQGSGALRAWLDVDQGRFEASTADVALTEVSAKVTARLEPVNLRHVTGRLGLRRLKEGLEFSTQGLQFETMDGLQWPGGNVRVAVYPQDARTPAHGEVEADRLDLAAMAEIARRLPLPEGVHKALSNWAPRGLVERVQANWSGATMQQLQFAAKGRVVGLEIAPDAETAHERPGLKGAELNFDFNQAGGRVGVSMRNGQLDFPGLYDEPQMPFDQLTGDVRWKRDGAHLSVDVPNLRFSNADAQGELQLKWHTGEAQASLGVLDLQGSLSRADAARVHRYLPTSISKEVRDYVRSAIPAGNAATVKFKVKGPLDDFPFETAKQGEFRISANLKDVTYDYAPALVLEKGSRPWPALVRVAGELVIDRSVLQVRLDHSNFIGRPDLRINKVEGIVSKLYDDAKVDVTADIQGPLSDAVAVVNGSPLGGMMDQALAATRATGVADYRFKLAFPIAAVDRIAVQGSVALGGNDIHISPDIPPLVRARATVAFTESGFSINAGQASALGGDMRIDGGLQAASIGAVGKAAPRVLRMQGTATADGLRDTRELGLAARIARFAGGSTTYAATLGLRGGVPELLVTSNLSGLSLRLPAPFTKPAEAVWPLRLETAVTRTALKSGVSGPVAVQDQLKLDVGRLLNVAYVRDISTPQTHVLRGAIALGLAADEAAPMPDSGVLANFNASSLDLDVWSDVASALAGSDGAASASPSAAQAHGDYLPTTAALRVTDLTLGGRKLNHVVVGAVREGSVWRANVDAAEVGGYIEYRQPGGASAGRLYARLGRLVIGPNVAKDVENMLSEQPASIPALDLVADDFELRGKKLGRLEIDAVNMGAANTSASAAREWRLNRFNIITPEAVFNASGNWADLSLPSASALPRSAKERRRTVLNFKLAIDDSGALLTRLGMKGVVRKGSGKIEGQVAWMGSPITLDYPSLGGNVNVNVENGQFLKAEPGIAKLLGVLSLQSLPRRLVLDFRDVFSDGFSFDFLRGDVTVAQGIARTNNLQMKGVNAAVLMEGQADIAKETQKIRVVVVPELNAGSASLIASVINPVVGLSTFLAQVILRRPLIEAATQEFMVDGTWVDPKVTKVNRKTGQPEAPK